MRSICRAAGVTKPQQTTIPKTQLFTVQLIIRFRIALQGCISIPAIQQTLAGRIMRALLRARTLPKNRK
jgi:hypothetical protein